MWLTFDPKEGKVWGTEWNTHVRLWLSAIFNWFKTEKRRRFNIIALRQRALCVWLTDWLTECNVWWLEPSRVLDEWNCCFAEYTYMLLYTYVSTGFLYEVPSEVIELVWTSPKYTLRGWIRTKIETKTRGLCVIASRSLCRGGWGCWCSFLYTHQPNIFTIKSRASTCDFPVECFWWNCNVYYKHVSAGTYAERRWYELNKRLGWVLFFEYENLCDKQSQMIYYMLVNVYMCKHISVSMLTSSSLPVITYLR